MTAGTHAPQVALLIDADNTPAAGIGRVFADLAPRGLVTVRRAYGNWAKPQLTRWQEPLLEHAIQAVHQFDHAVGKNATDMALTIDAMDLLHSRRPDVLAIVSSDADFTPLAVRLRSAGVTVIGYGGFQASDAFRLACTEFVEYLPAPVQRLRQVSPTELPKTPALVPVATTSSVPRIPAQPSPAQTLTMPEMVRTATPTTPTAQAASQPGPDDDGVSASASTSNSERLTKAASSVASTPVGQTPKQAAKPVTPTQQKTSSKPVPTPQLRGDTALMNRLRKAVTSASDASGWAGLSAVGQALKSTDIASRYGYSSLSKLLLATDAFQWKHQGQAPVAVKLKQTA